MNWILRLLNRTAQDKDYKHLLLEFWVEEELWKITAYDGNGNGYLECMGEILEIKGYDDIPLEEFLKEIEGAVP